jgi:uroporphyrinogen-III synthase
MRVLVTRPAEEARAFAALLAAEGIDAVLAPLLSIEFVDAALPPLAGVQALLVTSVNGVRALAARGVDRQLPLYAVGDATAAAAREAGFTTAISAAGDWRDLAALIERDLRPQNGRLLHAAGADTAGDLDSVLSASGFAVERAVLYRAVAAARLPQSASAALGGDDAVQAVAFFSPRSARIFLSLVEAAGLSQTTGHLTAFCLSPAIAGVLNNAKPRMPWRAIRTSARPNADSLVEEIRATIEGQAGGALSGSGDMEQTSEGAPRPNEAERIIAAFGGIRPMAKAVNLPVTTVQGWKERGAIPIARMAEIRLAAGRLGINLGQDAVVLNDDIRASTPAEEVRADKVEQPPASGVRAAEAADAAAAVLEARGRERSPARALWFGLGLGIAFLGGALLAWQFAPVETGVSAAAVEGLRGRIGSLADQLDEQSKRRQADAAAMQARLARMETSERTIGEHRDRLTNVAASTAALAARLERLDAELKAVAARPGTAETEIRALRESFQRLAERVDGMAKGAPDAASLAPLTEQLRQIGERVARVEQRTTQLGERAAPADSKEWRAPVEKLAAELQAVAREVNTLRRDLSALQERLESLNAASARHVSAPADTALVLAIGQTRQAIVNGSPYGAPLDALSGLTAERPEFRAPLDKLRKHAEHGVPTLMRLRSDFERLSVEMLRASVEAETGGDWLDRVWARLRTLVTIRRTGEVQGDTPRARIARAEAALARNDLAAAVNEIEALPAQAKRPAEKWLQDARARLEAESALAELDRLVLGVVREGAPAAKP